MGCGASKKNQQVVPENRRRLSLGEIGEDDGSDQNFSVTEEDRSMLMELTEQQLFDFVKAEGRRYSLGSQTDQNLHNVSSFGSKTTKLEGEHFDPTQEHIGYACKKGLKPEAPNQDSFLIMKIEGQYALYGVFDGHGRKGHDVSNFVKDHFPKILFSSKSFPDNPEEALSKAFEKMQYLIEKATVMKTIDATRSGTTCSIVLHIMKENVIYVAHVGDSRVVLGKKAAGNSPWEAVDLTIDHKPDLPGERARIEKAGGIVVFDGGWNYRVFAKGKKDSRGKRYPGLNMSRAMGDLTGYHDAGISASPDVTKQIVPSEPSTAPPPEAVKGLTTSDADIIKCAIHPETDKFILLCSDGVWEFISSEAGVGEVAKFKPGDATNAAEHLASQAWQRWMAEMDGQVVDDITVVLIHLDGG